MSQARAAAGMDRLPWLTDEPTPPKRRGTNGLTLLWAVVGILLVAGASYWMGARSWNRQTSPTATVQRGTTVALPQPRPAEPQQPQVILEPAPQVTPAPQREVPMAQPRAERRTIQLSAPKETASSPLYDETAEAAAAAPAAPAAAQPAPVAVPKPLTAWPASRSQGAAGRIVRIGAFGTRQQAKLGWRYMVQAYPAVAHLKATVVGESNSRGRHFYRFQIGTTSQAHSEVLCQRMEKIHLSCAVVGLAWKPKGVER